MTYLDMSGYIGVCRGLSGFVEPGGYMMPCVCVRMCVCECVCRGLSGFVEPGGYMMPNIYNHVLSYHSYPAILIMC